MQYFVKYIDPESLKTSKSQEKVTGDHNFKTNQ